MRRVLLLLPLLALAGCKEEVPQGGVKVTVSYDGFKPRCVRVIARDMEGGHEPLSDEVAAEKVKGEAAGGSIVVGVLPPDNWGSEVEVEAQAFERACDGEPVVKNSQRVTMTRGQTSATTLSLQAKDTDGDGYVARLSGGTDCNDGRPDINPGVTEELCNGVDDNCNDQSDTVELQLGQACTEGAGCAGTRACGDNGKVGCNAPSATMAYPDVDRDGHGDKNATATAFCDGVPVGFVTSPNDDCDDRAGIGANVFPGAQDLCDGKDNDCDGPSDEDFPLLNQACSDSITQCGGTQQCTPSGTATTCVITQQASTWYPDDDGDGYGRNSGAQQTCMPPAASVSQGNDCDDGNPFTHPNADELCDSLDNDCNSQPEATTATCPASGSAWGVRTEGSTTQIWYSVSTWTPGGVWAVGDNNRRAVLRPGDTNFTVTASTAGACGDALTTAWYAVWADPNNNGRAYFTSAGGRLANQDATNTACTQVTVTDLATYGITGVRNNSVLELYGVSASSSANDGAAFSWDGATTTVNFNTPTNDIDPVLDIHGTTRNTIFAVGGYASGTVGPRIYRFVPGDGTWQTQNVQSISGLGRLNGIWVVSDKLAFAVGDKGSALKWNGTAWSKVTFPNSDDLTSVVAFGANSVYATALSGTKGRIYRYNGTEWTKIHEIGNVQFSDIAGTSPADLWVVGNKGNILHWPQ
ncbi:putative metal-binding motif-containing protein [Pyxidicoccus sp. MSG2]|uniref:putative metal-binding motif-containing protein n=1 Tax=Pyxidicoccus sp. MSG2 TaxID=2996790 RepID=UPI00226DE301|nr:putative metal-binding motif-containing protein [Pyxidicoccus sp. MSG2]MCY1019520.1 putative metal-binding motif-containing protein [Pyxidicoccus sp. MSG2]